MKYLTGLLNSRIIFFWLKFKGKKQGEQLQIDKAPLLDIPIYKPKENDKELQEIALLVEHIRELVRKSQEIKLDSEKAMIEKQIEAYESKIDNIVYKLYGISESEKKIIEDSLK